MSPASTAIPARLNLFLGALFIAINACAMFVLPGFATLTRCAVAVVLVIASTPAHWALVHDAIHGQLVPTRHLNALFGRVLAIAFGVPFRAVRFAHLRHHRYNRTACAREEIYDPATQSRVAAYAWHFLRISVGLYLGELMLSLLCFLPRAFLRPRLRAMCQDLDDGSSGMAALIDREPLGSAALAEIRFDALCIVAMLTTSAIVCGRSWPLLALLLLGRAFVISQLDHAPHHDTPLDERDHALNLRAPRWVEAGLLNFNIHRTHHHHPHLPWRALAQARDHRAEDVSLWRAVLRQWRGPIALAAARAKHGT